MHEVKSESEVAQLCLTLWDPVNCSSVHGIFQARELEWCAIAISKSHKRHLQNFLTSLSFCQYSQCTASTMITKTKVEGRLEWAAPRSGERTSEHPALDPALIKDRPRKWLLWLIWLLCACAKSLQSCLTLCNPMDYSPPGSSVHRILQARILAWVAISFSRRSFQSRDWATSPVAPALQADSLQLSHQRRPCVWIWLLELQNFVGGDFCCDYGKKWVSGKLDEEQKSTCFSCLTSPSMVLHGVGPQRKGCFWADIFPKPGFPLGWLATFLLPWCFCVSEAGSIYSQALERAQPRRFPIPTVRAHFQGL